MSAENGKILVAYFSASGVTAAVAQEIAAAVGGDRFELRPKQPYTAADLNWMDRNSRSSLEMSDPASRPALAERLEGVERYQTVFLGFPVWWYVEPRIVDSFLEQYDLAGKAVIPFATSGGSGIEKAAAHLRAAYPAVDWRPGRLLRRGEAAGWARAALKQGGH